MHLACAIVFVGAVAFEVLVIFRCNGFQCVATLPGELLLVKVALAFGVLGVFAQTLWAGARGRMDVCRFRLTHRIVLAMMVGIVVIAKLMFSGVVI